MWGFDKLELIIKGVSNDYPHIYIWPERGNVDYFLSKLAPKGQIADRIRIREAGTDKLELVIKRVSNDYPPCLYLA